MARDLDVYLLDDHVGTLRQDDHGAKAFVYAPAWLAHPAARPLSLSLPLRAEPYADRSARAFFGGLLPDGDLRTRLAQHLGVSPRNEFAMLEIIGRECAGAISIVPSGEPLPASAPGTATVLDDARLASILRELPRRPLFVGEELRLSLAGAQDKLAVCMVGDRVALPRAGAPSTHILKTPIAGYDATVANELFCLRLAAALDLPAAPARALRVGAIDVLCVERYDRRVGSDGKVTRVHQEDFCQALGFPADLKYQSEGGPTLRHLFDLLTAHASRPAIDRLVLLRAVLFGFLIGNADAHAKNFAVLHGVRGVALAPLYDQMCTLVYPPLSTALALRIGSARSFAEVDARALEAMARACGLAPAQVWRTGRDLVERLDDAVDRVIAEEPALHGVQLVADVVASARSRVAALRRLRA